jgi:hypothetical protein
MKKSTLINMKELLESRSKKPWACFETEGITENGLGVAMHWNEAFVKHLHTLGIQGANDHETLQLFFMYMSSRIADGLIGEDTINPEAMPNLTSEANKFVS